MPRYDGPVIDPHHHLWDYAMRRHPWLVSEANEGLGNLAPLRRDYLPADYLADAAGQSVVGTVHIEASWTPDDPVAETRWLESIERPGGVAARYVAHAALDHPDAAATLEAQAAFPRVVGIRDIVSWHPDPAKRFVADAGRMASAAWREGFARLRPLGLHFELMMFPNQVADAARLLADLPDQPVVLNHCGSPIDRDADGMRRWRDALKRLAEAPNLSIKISDLVAYDNDWTLDGLRPVVEHCIDCFGPERSMFASDFPVAGLHATFDQIYDGFRLFASGFSEQEQVAMFHDNAHRTYRFD